MILTRKQVAVLERLRVARATVAGPVYLGREAGDVAAQLRKAGLVAARRDGGKKLLYELTSAGDDALARQGEQIRLFAREPGIDDPREADAFRQLEASVRRWKAEREMGSDKLVLCDAEASIDLALGDIDVARARAAGIARRHA